jgi:hypothetical protein
MSGADRWGTAGFAALSARIKAMAQWRAASHPPDGNHIAAISLFMKPSRRRCLTSG